LSVDWDRRRAPTWSGTPELTGSALPEACRLVGRLPPPQRQSFKRTVLELGGKCPFIICEDADMEEAVAAGSSRCLWFPGTRDVAPLPGSSCPESHERMNWLSGLPSGWAYKPALPEDTDESCPHSGPSSIANRWRPRLHFADVARQGRPLLTGGYRLKRLPSS
jgi:hypothetical protein